MVLKIEKGGKLSPEISPVSQSKDIKGAVIKPPAAAPVDSLRVVFIGFSPQCSSSGHVLKRAVLLLPEIFGVRRALVCSLHLGKGRISGARFSLHCPGKVLHPGGEVPGEEIDGVEADGHLIIRFGEQVFCQPAIPVHTQPYYSAMGFAPEDYPEAMRYYNEAISIPMYHGLTFEQQDTVVAALKEALT